MSPKPKSKILLVVALVTLASACATHKVAETAAVPASPETTSPPPPSGTTPATPSAADQAAALKAQQMADDKARQEKEAADRAAEQAAAQAKAEQDTAAKTQAERQSAASRATAALLTTRIAYFDFDRSEIHASDYPMLEAHAAYLAKHSEVKLQVEGNCDERGTREYNMALGERRAKAVAAFLVSHGASEQQLSVISYGKEKPVDDGHNESAWSKNRRDDLNYLAGAPAP